jgi:signal transduction histidine kinase
MAARPAAGDNRCVEAEARLSRPAWIFDAAIAAAATLAAVAGVIAQARHDGGAANLVVVPGLRRGILVGPQQAPSAWFLLGVALTAAPLAFRRRYPATAFIVIFAAVIATHSRATIISFVTAIVAAYSAVLYSRFRRTALLAVLAGAVVVTAAFPDTTPPVPARFTALLILVPVAALAVGMRGWRQRAGDSAARLRRAEAEHEAETRRAVEAERARIASELHDVVTHNVSVMVVQAGAARRVLDSSPDEARGALLAVEASGRTAMGELRHLLGLLAPAGGAAGGEEAVLVPQPGAGQIPALVDRVRAAGLDVELTVTGARDLPPGVDLAAYRVVQEALTNVIKHASAGRAVVSIEYRTDDLLITVLDEGGYPQAGSSPKGTGGRGLIGLRERIGLYGGELDAGPRPGGGWRVQARIPLDGPGGPGANGAGGELARPVRSQFLGTRT